ncbi:SpoIIIAH-like family protein [Oceanirhabdus sp. W0125-5]|uniref:SpoIIIAH-like family protein n=1 Tax=Oceanirhabdus sp. W0125-5 TaxID=2999116 RepID=UPI0022F2D4E6|nr:SpoIIIAH-like family protein [Oceanirhabdus sp. W0125-5]WBW95328.1 SpoIIIAH-like family protein [Oceanirhabdus sp. W0125-5]
MDRKQAGILVSLLVLIVIVGVASWKLNGDLPPLNSPVGNLGVEQTEEENDDFIKQIVERDTTSAANMQVLQDIIDNKDNSEEVRNQALEQQTRMVVQLEKEQSLERQLKAQGYENVLCLVADDFNNVKVYVKLEEDLTEEQMAEIRAIVVSQTEIREVEISRK